MRLSLDFGRKLEEVEKVSDRELTADYINYAVNQKHKEGIEGQLRRVWGRIQRKLDDALEQKLDSIDLEEAEKDFIAAAFKESKFPAGLSKFVIVVEDEISKF